MYTQGLTRLRVHSAILPTVRRLDEGRVLSLETGEGPLRVPVPGRFGREEQVHVLEGALVALRVEGPDHGDGDDVADGEDVEGFLADGAEHDGAEEGLDELFVLASLNRIQDKNEIKNSPASRFRYSSQPHPMRCRGHVRPEGRSQRDTATARSARWLRTRT